MYVDIHINGEHKRSWHFENNYREPFCEAGHQETKRLWSQITEKCKQEIKTLPECGRYEMYITVRARVQPKDIPDHEYQEFVNTLVKSRNHLYKIEKLKIDENG